MNTVTVCALCMCFPMSIVLKQVPKAAIVLTFTAITYGITALNVCADTRARSRVCVRARARARVYVCVCV